MKFRIIVAIVAFLLLLAAVFVNARPGSKVVRPSIDDTKANAAKAGMSGIMVFAIIIAIIGCLMSNVMVRMILAGIAIISLICGLIFAPGWGATTILTLLGGIAAAAGCFIPNEEEVTIPGLEGSE